jgi:hypothetical protein
MGMSRLQVRESAIRSPSDFRDREDSFGQVGSGSVTSQTSTQNKSKSEVFPQD